MPRLRVRVELNRGGLGVPLNKLASVVHEAQRFFEMLAEDVTRIGVVEIAHERVAMGLGDNRGGTDAEQNRKTCAKHGALRRDRRESASKLYRRFTGRDERLQSVSPDIH